MEDHRGKIRSVILRNARGETQSFPAGDLNAASQYLAAGNCHSLAAALHEETGFPIIAFYQSEEACESDDDPDPDRVRHFAVISPESLVLDGDGAMGLRDLEAATGWIGEILQDGKKEMEAIILLEEREMARDWLPLAPALVSSFVGPVLEIYKACAAGQPTT